MTGRVKINLGSGVDQAPGWIAYDRSRMPVLARSRLLRMTAALAKRLGFDGADAIYRWPPATLSRDVTKGIPHESCSVDAIYSSHMLEHLERGEARSLLRECNRVLRPGGTLRIVVPDLEVIVRAYIEANRDLLPAKDPAIADAFLASLDFRPAPRGRLPTRAIRRLLRIDDGGHKWMYDEESMLLLLRESGFPDARRVEFREGWDTEAARLDSRSPFHVHVEAVKPSGDQS